LSASVLLVLAVALVAVQRLFELVLARKNERRARARGAVERGQRHYRLIVALHTLWLVCTLVEGLLRGPELPAFWPVPLALFLLVQPLRYWAIFSLG
jgi:methyltransferase